MANRPLTPGERARNIRKLLDVGHYKGQSVQHPTLGTRAACPPDFATDVLADLIHYCDDVRVDFKDVLRVARQHHEAELATAVRGESLKLKINGGSEDAARSWLKEFSGLCTEDGPFMADGVRYYLTDVAWQAMTGEKLTGATLCSSALDMVREVAVELYCQEV